MRRTFLLFALAPTLLYLCGRSSAQTAAPTPSDDVVRISSKLVQVDAIVTDKGGEQIRDLKDSDFEILQDGKPQTIKHFSYIDQRPRAEQQVGADGSQAPAVSVRPGRAGGRIVTFIVDDGNCYASFSGMNAARDALKKFIREQMLPGDRVAIYRTRAGSSMLQQYISDKTVLLRTADKISWFPSMGSCATSDGSIFEAAKATDFPVFSATGTKIIEAESDQAKKNREAAEDIAANSQTVGTIGVVNYVVRGLQRVGGRKVVFLLSDGFALRDRAGAFMGAKDILQDLAEAANRASVVFDTIDVRGLVNPDAIEARDQVYVQSDPATTDKLASARQNVLNSTRDPLLYLAEATGGKFYHDDNFLDTSIRKALVSESGYYLLSYEPGDDTFNGKDFHKIVIRLKVPGLSIRSRSGFRGVVDQTVKKKKRSENSDLYEAIAAPLPEAGLDLRMTATFVNTNDAGNIVRALVHIGGDGITFTDEAGQKRAALDVVAVTLDEKNNVVDEFTRTHVFKVDPAAIPFIRQNGVDYTTEVPVKKAGIYNFRVAVRDAASKAIGSATQIVDIANIKKQRMFISGLVMAGVDPDGKYSLPEAAIAERAISVPVSSAVPALRRFKRGTTAAYAYTVYNAQPDAAGSRNVAITVNLYRGGQVASKGIEQPAQFEKQADLTRIKDYGYLRLGSEMPAGDYALQIIVRDLNKNVVSTQTIDFEITE